MAEWKTMQSAPRDGTKFDAWDNGERITDVYWSDIQDTFCTDGIYGPEEPSPLPYPFPTHWMPLPEAPGSAAPSPDTGRDAVERIITDERTRFPDAGPEVVARHVYSSLAAHPDAQNALWLIQGLKDQIGRERTENNRIMRDFKDAAPGAAAVAEHDAFLRANPHLNEADPNVRS